ncbi:MAG: sigma-54-dependent Fis family transcriptional regulator, partial [Deltaproteobacteria bacterium]|nr:sigma-54-dependent Fis family transcriptional regulator [Deltaproteobacteria bacterium]
AMSKRRVVGVSPDAMDILLNYHWPGNVRQLENMIERAFALGIDETIQLGDLPPEIRGSKETSETKKPVYALRENEIVLIKRALRETNGNKAEASKLLGINITTLYRKIERYGVKT